MDQRGKPKTVGGMFGLPLSLVPRAAQGTNNWLFFSGQAQFYANARCALYSLLKKLDPGCVWLPSYICPSVLDPANALNLTVKFYEVNSKLEPDLFRLADVRRGEVVVVMAYFGFPADTLAAKAAKQQGAWVVEDASQALLSRHVGNSVDYVIYSPRKLVAVPDGGILVICGDNPIPEPANVGALTAWQLMLLEAAIQRREFDARGGDNLWFDIYRRASERAPVGAFPMCDLSVSLLHNGIDFEAAAQQRRRNFTVLSGELSKWGLYAGLDEDTAPLGYPVRVCCRDTVRKNLYAHSIYPPVHWDLKSCVPAEFHESLALSDQIMTVPCDQRYDESDMGAVVKAVVSSVQKYE
jgi:dTDP-4-amino-4,6-dideoxygalactose transaminase